MMASSADDRASDILAGMRGELRSNIKLDRLDQPDRIICIRCREDMQIVGRKLDSADDLVVTVEPCGCGGES